MTPEELLEELMQHHNESTALLTMLKQRLNAMTDTDNLPLLANKRIGSDFNEFYIESLENYTKSLMRKLDAIECGDCGKTMLYCKCDEQEEE